MNLATQPLAPRVASGYALHRVDSAAEWREVRALRHRALASAGELPEHVNEPPDDGFDSALNSATYLLMLHGRPRGSTRTSASSASRRWPLPSAETFDREIQASVGWDASIVEASLCVIDPPIADTRAALFQLMRAPMQRCEAEHADWLLIAVPEAQIGFHRRMFNMEILSGLERGPRLALPRVLMGMDFRKQAPILYRRIPVLAMGADEPILA